MSAWDGMFGEDPDRLESLESHERTVARIRKYKPKGLPETDKGWESRAEELAKIAQADCKIVSDYTGRMVIFTRPNLPNDRRFSFDSYDDLNPGAKVCGERLDKDAVALGKTPGYPGSKESHEFIRNKKITLSDGTELTVPEDYDDEKDGKTTAERFDAIQETILAVNREIMRKAGDRYLCEDWAKVPDTSNQPVQIVSQEEWTCEKFIYRAEPIEDMVVVMRQCPDENGKGGGQEIILKRAMLADLFSTLHSEMESAMQENGYRNYADFDHHVKTLVGGRREFARALVDMSNQTLVGARADAKKEHTEQKSGFYDSQKGYGLF